MDGTREDKRLYLSFRNHFVASASVPFLAVFFTVLLILFNFDRGMLIAFSVGFIINTIPVFYLHLEYWLKNKNEKYEIHFDELIRYRTGKREIYKTSEMERVEIYMSPALYRGSNFHILGIEAYHYARIYLKSGEKLAITCLLTPKVEQAIRGLRGVKIERKKQLFCTIDEG